MAFSCMFLLHVIISKISLFVYPSSNKEHIRRINFSEYLDDEELIPELFINPIRFA